MIMDGKSYFSLRKEQHLLPQIRNKHVSWKCMNIGGKHNTTEVGQTADCWPDFVGSLDIIQNLPGML